MKRSPIIFISLLLLCSQNLTSKREEINLLINSGDKTKVIEGFYLIGEQKDTSFVHAIFTNPGDSRITNVSKFKGISVYQAKMIAIKKITGIEPPKRITYSPDTSIIQFYLTLSRDQNLIK